MSDRPLSELLKELHAELGRAPALDAESRRMLDVVVDDIRRVEAAEPARAGSRATPTGLEALAVRFEADHPTMALALRQIADVLGKAGI